MVKNCRPYTLMQNDTPFRFSLSVVSNVGDMDSLMSHSDTFS
jgi:hypothetical protein